jgi:hypothetical protein
VIVKYMGDGTFGNDSAAFGEEKGATKMQSWEHELSAKKLHLLSSITTAHFKSYVSRPSGFAAELRGV